MNAKLNEPIAPWPFFADDEKQAALDVLTSEDLLFITSPNNGLPSDDNEDNQFSKERDDDDDCLEDLW